jgi:tetratricopeptide (TPR) repeat protein
VAYNGLGLALEDLKKPAEAEKAYRKAIELRLDFPEAHTNLGHALLDLNKPAEAEQAYRKAIALQPDLALARHGLGNALADQKKLAEAEKAYRKAIDLRPDAEVYNDLGIVLRGQSKLGEAVQAYRRAIHLQPDLAGAYSNLGVALHALKQSEEAEKAFRKAIHLQPDYANAYNNLGITLRHLKKLDEAIKAFRKAHQLLPDHLLIRTNLRQTERMLQLDRKLTACLEGKDRPASPRERLVLGEHCGHYRERPRTALRFCLDAFKEAPKLTEDLQAQHRYHAACFAVLAAAGKGRDAAPFSEEARAGLRLLAFSWLRADLNAFGGIVAARKDLRPAVRLRLALWLDDADLASVRAPAPLTGLPEAERTAWSKLWADVAALHKLSTGP